MAMSKYEMAKQRSKVASILPLVVGRVEPANECAVMAFDELADCKESLSLIHQENFHAEPSSTRRQPFEYPDDVGTYKPDTLRYHARYEAYLNLIFRMNEDGKVPLKYTFGRGNKGMSTDGGVTHLMIAPGHDPRGVIAQHLSIEFDLESGVPVIIGNDDNFPVYVWKNNEKYLLKEGQKSVLLDKINRFGVGLLEFTLEYSPLDPQGRQKFLQVRDYAFVAMGLPCPDRRIKALPNNRPFNNANDIIIQDYVGKGGWGEVSSGVDALSGGKRAVKRMIINQDGMGNEIEGEIIMNLSHMDSPGLIQAFEISDDLGNSFGPGQASEAAAFFRACSPPYVVYIIMPLAHCDLLQWNKLLPVFSYQVKVCEMPLRGLCAAHADGWIIRDISPGNILVTNLDPVTAVLADFGKAVKALAATTAHIGPRALQAPEIDGHSTYTNKVDVWSFALTVTLIILPDLTEWPGWQHDAPQTPAFMAAVFRKFDECAQRSPLAAALVDVLCAMLNPDPVLRISAEAALRAWPRIADNEEGVSSSTTDGALLRSAKKARTSEDSVQTAAVEPTSLSRRAATGSKVEPEAPSLSRQSIPSSQGHALIVIDNDTVNGLVARKFAAIQNVKRGAEKPEVDKKAMAAKEAEDRQKAAEAREAHRAAFANFEENTANMRKQREAVHREAMVEAKRAKDAKDAEEARRIQEAREARAAKKAKEDRKRQEAELRRLDDLFNDEGDLFEDSI